MLVAVAAALAYMYRGDIAADVMERGIVRNLSADPIAALPDGLHVALCGAGGPLVDPVRSGPCVAVVAGKTLLVVDAGSGAARNLTRMGFSPGRIAAVFLTHFHSDHIDDLGELALQRWTNGNASLPLPVYGADGVGDVVAGFNLAYKLDSGYRTTHHGEVVAPPGGAGMTAMPFPTPELGASAVLWERDGAKVIVFRVEHDPANPAVGYRFEYGGRSAVVSGDTHKSANLAQFAKGADLLAHEALSHELVARLRRAATEAGRPNVAKIASDIPSYHTSPVEAAEVATEAGVRHLLLYHVLPPLPVAGLEAAFVDGVDAAYSGPVTVGRDGTIVTMPAGTKTIDVGTRF